MDTLRETRARRDWLTFPKHGQGDQRIGRGRQAGFTDADQDTSRKQRGETAGETTGRCGHTPDEHTDGDELGPVPVVGQPCDEDEGTGTREV